MSFNNIETRRSRTGPVHNTPSRCSSRDPHKKPVPLHCLKLMVVKMGLLAGPRVQAHVQPQPARIQGAVNNGRLGQKSSMVVPQVLACPTPLLAALPAQVRPPSASEPDGGIISYREPRHAAAPVMSLNNVYQNLFTRYLHNRRWSAAICRPPRVACLKFLFSPRLFLSLLFNPQQPPEGT